MAPYEEYSRNDKDRPYDIAAADRLGKDEYRPEQAPYVVDSAVGISHIYRKVFQVLLPEDGIDRAVHQDEAAPHKAAGIQHPPRLDGIRRKLGEYSRKGKYHYIQM